jgi:glycosyltransferase involved in cell wall biosynthesis
MTAVVIAAHDEAAVIGACLDALRAQHPADPELQIVVSANACTDDTAAIARRRGALVVDRPEPGKAAALNAGEQLVTGFPRVYLDADIVPPPGALAELVAVLGRAGVHAAVPRRRLETRGRAWPVRAYFAVNERLPAFTDGLFGRGMIALSAEGRARFDAFPELVADDLFLDSLFAAAEKATATGVEVVVEAPYTSRELLNRLVRVRRGSAQMRAAAEAGDVEVPVRASDRRAWLRVVLRDPRLLPAAVPYVAFTLLAARRARRSPTSTDWGRDASTRTRAADEEPR